MHDWVRALLDPAEIQPQPNAKKHITPPPKFELPPLDAPSLPASTRTRSRRSASPSKKAVSPRKPRQTRAMKEFGTPGTTAANESLQTSLDMTASTTEGTVVNGTAVVVEAEGEKTPASGKAKRRAEKSKKTADTVAEKEDIKKEEESEADLGKKAEAPKADVSVELPVTLPEGPSAAETEAMIAQAKENVQEAATAQQAEDKTSQSPSAKASKKRKTDDLSEDEEDDEASTQRAKKARVLEDKLKRERVRNRALFGVTAAFALA